MAAPQALCSCALFLVLLLAPHACTAASTVLQDKCRSYAAGTQEEYDYCIRTLQSGRASAAAAAAADARSLAAIAANVAREAARATATKIAAWKDAETVPARQESLTACAKEYRAAVHGLRAAAEAAVSARVAEGLQVAQKRLSDALGAPLRCDAAFSAAGEPSSPLDAADRDLDKVINLAISILPVPSSPGV
ncbi:hypothetical protein ACP70R_023327 [Stipagrostis hirtigluma subsp. patula]